MSKMQWKSLDEFDSLEILVQDSFENPQIIFKHSYRCIISRTVLARFESKFRNLENLGNFYLLDVIQSRDLSQEIAEKFQVRHESPQLLLIDNGKCSQHSSHSDILSMSF